MSAKISVQDIDAVLPQTQCGLCGYKGCRPYAEAMLSGTTSIQQCPPGGFNHLACFRPTIRSGSQTL